MKIPYFLMAILLLPVSLMGQGVVQKQTYTPTSQTVYQKQTQPANVQTQSQSRQTYQPVQQYSQPVNQQLRVDKQMNTHLQQGYSTNNNYPNSSSVSSSTTGKIMAANARGLQSIAKNHTLTKRTSDKPDKQEVADIGFERKEITIRPNILVNTISDSSTGLNPNITVNGIYDPCKAKPIEPEAVYKFTPAFRLCYTSCTPTGWNDLAGYGVHIAAFLSYNYCVGVANYIRKKYHATSYIFEDQKGYPHYHLVFGRWLNVKSAQIFREKVRREAPNAFICFWRNNFDVLLPDGKIMQNY